MKNSKHIQIKQMKKILYFSFIVIAFISCQVYETPNKDKSNQKDEFLAYVNSFKEAGVEEDNQAVLDKVTSIRDNFINVIKEEGVKVSYYPEVIVVNTPALMSYWGDRKFGYLLTPNWESADPNLKRLFQYWIEKSGVEDSAKHFFNQNFNWFLVAHELGHYLQETQKIRGIDYNDRWNGEIYANQVAVSFWMSQGKEKELTDFIENTTKIMNFLKSPNNSSESEEDYFNNHHRELAQDPNKYAYYQFLFYKMAFDEKDQYKKVSLHVVK